MPQSSFQRQYYLHRLCGTPADLDALAAAMGQDGAYAPVSAWFARWDEMAQRRALHLERDMGLVCATAARPEFLNEAMRQLIRELDRTGAPPGPTPVATAAAEPAPELTPTAPG
jgi:hypothetical protein